MRTKRVVGMNWYVGMALGSLAVVALATGCSEETSTRPNRPVRPAVARKSAVNPPAVPAKKEPMPMNVEPLSGTLETGTTATGTAAIASAGKEISATPLTPPTTEETRAAWREGVAHFESGDYLAATTTLKIAAAGRPDEPYAHYLLGLSLWKAGEHEAAEQALERAANLDDGSIRTWINLARVRLDRDDPQGALDATESALAIESNSADALHQRGRALFNLDRVDEALAVLARARAADPEDGHIANTLGYYLIVSGRSADALEPLEAARAELPDVAYVRNNLGTVYESLGRIDEAAAEFRAAIEAGDPEGKAAASMARIMPSADPAVSPNEGDLPPPERDEPSPVAQKTSMEDGPSDR